MVWRSGSLLLASALLAAGPAAGLQRLTDEEDPLALARVIREEIASPEDEYDIPYEIALTRGEFDGDDPTGQLSANTVGQQSEQCVPEKRAKVAEGFLRTFDKDYKPRFAAAFKGVKESAYLTVGDWRFKQMFRNFMVHAHNLTCGTSDHIVAVNVGLDKASYNECQAVAKGIVQPSNVGSKGKFELRCIDISGWLPKELFAESAAQAWSCAYNMVLWTKPHIIQAAVEAAEQPVMMIDTDVILHQNVLKIAPGVLAACKGCIAITGREYASENRQNTGTVYSGKAGLPVLREWARVDPDFLNAKEGDQSAMQHLMQTNPDLHSQLAVFNLAEVGECGIPGSHATHYNCLTGKKVNMEMRGHWDTRLYREPAQLRCREPSDPVEVLEDTGATKGTKNLVMPGRHRNIGGREASGASQLKFQGATSCSTMGCEGNPARHAIDGFVNTVAGVNQLNTWTGDLGKVMQVARVEVTFESCICEAKDSMLLEVSSDSVNWKNYGSVGELTLWEGDREVAFERPLNARYIRLRPSASYTSKPRRNDKFFAIREVEAFGKSELLQEAPEQPLTPLQRRQQKKNRRERAERRRRFGWLR
mmetsp:Transcript_30276/g.84930  ORF Transcript_30276/g.84930 Transcript_30276/m.84930 type:complete len:591 (+) Transcript_30276:64-1836(+)